MFEIEINGNSPFFNNATFINSIQYLYCIVYYTYSGVDPDLQGSENVPDLQESVNVFRIRMRVRCLK
jgi:hypothetical protein